MAVLPAPASGLREVTETDFRRGPRARGRLRVGLVFLAAGLAGWLAAERWGRGTGMAFGALAASGWVAALVAQWLCFLRDEPLVATLVEVGQGPGEAADERYWRLAEPVPGRLASHLVGGPLVPVAGPGDKVAIRVRETGLGLIQVIVGQPTVEGWRLPPPQPVWPWPAQLGGLWATLVLLGMAGAALAPTELRSGQVVTARQREAANGLGQEPWRLVVRYRQGGEERHWSGRVEHGQVLRLLPPRGQRQLMTPGWLPAAERERLWNEFSPVNRRVLLRHTRLGPWERTSYVGPEP